MSTIQEPLTIAPNKKYALFPINPKYQDIWELYKRQCSSMWIPEEMDLAKDRYDFDNKLNNDERFFIKHILAFFAVSDGIVNENINTNYLQEIQIPEVQTCLEFQVMMENIHNETYSLLIDTYIKNEDEKTQLLNAIEHFPIIKQKTDWILKHINENMTLARRLIIFSIVEGVMFSGAFCAIYWLKKRNLMEGLCFSNELISRDESEHTKVAVTLYHKIVNKLSSEEVYDIFREAVKIEQEFICNSIPCNLLGMNSEMMGKYIEFVADRLLEQLGYEPLYKIDKDPTGFMELISLRIKTNFFEKRVSSYSKANSNASDPTELEFNTELDF